MRKNIRLLTSFITLGIIAISLVGVVYAITFEGQTSSTDNSIDENYILLTLGTNSSSDYTGSLTTNKVYYSSHTTLENTTWIPKLDTDTDGDDEDDAIKLGQTILNIDTTDSFPYIVKMSKTGTMDTSKFKVGVKIGDAAETIMAFGNTEFAITGSLTGDKTITVALYYLATTIVGERGIPIDISSDMDGASIFMTAYAED